MLQPLWASSRERRLTAPALDGCERQLKAEMCKAPSPMLGTLFLLSKCQLLLLLSLQVGIWCVQKQNWVLRVPAGFRGHSSQPLALLPLALCISHACLALFLLIEVSAPLSSACCQATPTPSYRCGSLLSGQHIGSLKQHSPLGTAIDGAEQPP